KKNKGRFKPAPFIAVVSFVAAIGISVTVFKNPVAKWGIRSAMQGIFGAKCDIGSVNVEIFAAQLTVNNLAQANADDPMKNLFQFDKLDLDFNLTQLLRSRLNIQNIEITGIALNTQRKTSGALPVKPKSAEAKAEKSDSTGFYDSLNAKRGTAVSGAKDSIVQKLAEYNPETIMKNIDENLQTKNVAKEVEEDIKKTVEQWKNRPEEIQKNVSDFKTSSEKLSKLNVSNLKTEAEIMAAISEIKTALEKGEKVKSDVDSTLSSFESDSKKVAESKAKLELAVKNDTDMVKNALPDLSLDGAKGFVSGTFDEFAYSLLGKYYPYLKTAVSYAGSMKSNSSSDAEAKNESVKKAKAQARKEAKLYAGRNVYWRKDTVPKLLIENVHGTGSNQGSSLDLKITNISSDMDKVGKPMIAKAVYNALSRTHNASLTVDARSESKDSLISGTYSGNNFPFTLDMLKDSNAQGVPSFNGTTSIVAGLSAEADYSFDLLADLAMNPVTIKSSPVSSETANRIYSNALSAVKSMNVKAKAGFDEKQGLDLNISCDADKIIAQALKSAVQKEMGSVQKEAEENLKSKLAEYTSGADSQLGQFSDISSKLKDSKSAADTVNKQLEAKKAELEKQLKSAASNAAKKAVTNKAGEAVNSSSAAKNAANTLKKFGL
uniref:TIGR03545 family protein n=1 Tax=Treponema sp. TaxID=166 RepID=UPI00388F6AD7